MKALRAPGATPRTSLTRGELLEWGVLTTRIPRRRAHKAARQRKSYQVPCPRHGYDTHYSPIPPAIEFGQSIIALQTFHFVNEVTSSLFQYWEIVYKKEVKGGAVTNALAGNVLSEISCETCTRRGHTKEVCWALGGSKEGQAPKWWKAPPGRELRQAFIEAARAATATATATVIWMWKISSFHSE